MGLLIGYENEKQEIARLRDMLLRADHYRSCGLHIPRGLFLYGVPGVGKTVLAHSLVENTDITLVELRAADCCKGDIQAALQQVFDDAVAHQPAVILLDELDKIAGTSEDFFMEENTDVQNMLLQALDTLSDDDAVLVVATGNDLGVLGSALVRPGRFDRLLNICVPDEETREQILRAYFDRLQLEKQLDYPYLARLVSGYSGAKIECLVNEVGILAVQSGTDTVTVEQVRSVMNRITFSGAEREPVQDPQKQRMVAVHEAGHAVVAMVLRPHSVFGATILPQGYSNGHTSFIPSEDSVCTVSEKENELTVRMAGHVAERIALGEYLLGSSDDLYNVQHYLEEMTQGEGVYGYEAFCGADSDRFRPGDIYPSSRCANQVICEKMKQLDARAEKILLQNRALFDAVVEGLLRQQTLRQDELLALQRQFGTNPVA